MNAKCVSVLDALKEIIEHHGADEPGVHSLVLAHADIAELIAADVGYDEGKKAHERVMNDKWASREELVRAENALQWDVNRRAAALARVKGE